MGDFPGGVVGSEDGTEVESLDFSDGHSGEFVLSSSPETVVLVDLSDFLRGTNKVVGCACKSNECNKK